MTVSFPAAAFKNADTKLADGTTTPGVSNTAFTLTFTVQGGTARLVDPGAGGSIDVNVLNDRNWVDVQFVAPTGLKIDAGSITDLDPEFTLTGAGVGSIVLDAARAPTLVMGDPGVAGATLTYRYWLTGRFAQTGDVTLTYLANSWSFNLATQPTVPAATIGPQYLDVVFPDAGDGYVIVASSVNHGEITLRLLDPQTNQVTTTSGWTVSIDTNTPVVQLDTNVFRYRLNITVAASPALSSVIVEYSFVSGSWQRQVEDGSVAAADVTWTTAPDPGTETFTLVTPGTSSLTLTLPSAGDAGVTSGFTLDPATVLNGDPVFADQDTNRNGIQIYNQGGWVVTLDETRLPTRIGTTNQYTFGILIDAVGSARSITFSPVLDGHGLGYTGTTSSGTQGGSSQNLHNLSSATNRTFIDVAFAPTAGNDIVDLGTLGDEFSIGGFGGAGVALRTTDHPVLSLGNGVYRFMLDGTFRPGAVDVDFQANTWNFAPARGPPGNLASTSTFLVAGASGELVRTIPASGDKPETVVTLAGAGVGADVLNGLGYIEVRFRPSSGNSIDRATIDGNEIEVRNAAGNLVPLTGSPIRVGTTDIYRYSFSGALAAGTYTVNFLAGTFADTAGIPNQAKSESFRVEVPTATILDPGPKQVLDREAVESRGWIDVTFSSPERPPRQRRLDHSTPAPSSRWRAAPRRSSSTGHRSSSRGTRRCTP